MISFNSDKKIKGNKWKEGYFAVNQDLLCLYYVDCKTEWNWLARTVLKQPAGIKLKDGWCSWTAFSATISHNVRYTLQNGAKNEII